MQLNFPLHGDPAFRDKLMSLAEYRLFEYPKHPEISSVAEFEEKVQSACGGFEKMIYQHLMQHYVSRRSPYKSMLLYHGLGVGKTCSSITIAESFLYDHVHGQEPRVLVVSPTALRKSYEDQIFSSLLFLDKNTIQNQCTGDTYAKLIHGNPEPELFMRRVLQLIRSRYKFLTYDNLVTYVEQNPRVSDKVIIIDEAHNLRQQETEKKTAEALETLIKHGKNNRVILLSATPMYNEPDEILWLLRLLLMNDKRENKLPKTLFPTHESTSLKESTVKLLSQLASEYISYIRGKNPFTFAVRLSPDASVFQRIQEPWTKPITDGIVAVPVGVRQKASKTKGAIASPKYQQWMNITYPGNGHGESGFWKVFLKPSSEENVFPATYRDTHKNALMPVPGKLDAIAPKIANICNIIRNSEGIVLVYSQFVWSGVVPIAVALEHMGFRRAGGANLIHNIDITPEYATYPGISFPKYCILSGDVKVMGSSKIEALRKQINSLSNLRGEEIKVVLITPIAGEGLSFRNIREVHVVDPWYHMNRTEQVIGRAIRTCSHTSLPVEERNVTVFLHACIMPDADADTADIHAYKIAARKVYQTSLVEHIIRDHAVDCPLQYHLNYQPKSSFPFYVAMRTSQQQIIQHVLGDTDEDEPKCRAPSSSRNMTLHTDVYANLIPTIMRRIEKHVLQRMKHTLYFPRDEIRKACAIGKDEIVNEALRRIVGNETWIPDHTLFLHRDGFVLVPSQTPKPQYEIPLLLESPPEQTRSETREVCDVDGMISSIPFTDDRISTLLFYMAVDSTCWDTVARTLLADQSKYNKILSLLAKQGAIVAKKELPRRVSSLQGDYIGYVHIFSMSDTLSQVWVKTTEYELASDADLRTLMQKRKQWTRPASGKTYGVLEPTKFSKDPSAPFRNTLKIMLPSSAAGKRRGVVCTSNKKNELAQIFKDLNVEMRGEATMTKDQLCFTIALEMIKQDVLYIAPSWKPV